MKKTNRTKRYTSLTSTNTSYSTVVDQKTMDQIHKEMKNPSKGTASLNKLLKEIESDKDSRFCSFH